MPPRANPSIVLMIAQAQRKMREFKELQFFGGDSLNMKRWSQVISVAGDNVPHCWRLVITPADPTTMMPFSVMNKPDKATNTTGGQVEPVHRTDGNYEYLMIPVTNFGGVTRTFKLEVEYTGVATFSLTQIG